MKKFGSFFPSHYDVTEIRDLKTNVKKGQFKLGGVSWRKLLCLFS